MNGLMSDSVDSALGDYQVPMLSKLLYCMQGTHILILVQLGGDIHAYCLIQASHDG